MMAQWIERLLNKSDSLSSVPRAHMKGGGNQHHKAVPDPDVPTHIRHTHTDQTNTHNNKLMFNRHPVSSIKHTSYLPSG